jgi:acyl transferase domain-containing protein
MNDIDPIAIVGVGCKLPGGVETVDDLFWALRDGRDCVTEVPGDRWDVDAYYDPDPLAPGKTYVRHGGFVDGIDRFDAAFFGISDVEAKRMDPQQRMALQTVWRALEDAGQSPADLIKTNTGVFLAMMNTNGYSQLKGAFEGMNGVTGYDAMSDAMSITAGRVSHFLGLEGPCLAVDTACSGSMVALHLARQSILGGECDSAIVLGVGAILHPGIHIAFSKVGLMSRAGRCMAFDERADGYVRGEGCVAVLIRRESVARERGDRVLARVMSTAVNQDGRTPAVTAPNGHTQEKVIRLALARSGVSPDDVGYVEAHGTGTPVGDPIEMGALVNVYGPGRSRDQPLYVGSVKSNFGHIESGAGLLGVVKGALSLDRETIFPSLHFHRLNPNIDVGHAPVEVPTQAIPWPRRGGHARMAGINSFGYSGTNAHTLLAEAAPPVSQAPGVVPDLTQPVVMSARTLEDLERLGASWADHLEQLDATQLGNVAFTSATGRAHLRFRLAAIGADPKDIADRLRKWAAGRTPQGLFQGTAPAGRKPRVAFVFTGQGAQYAGMGRELYEHQPTFRTAIERCSVLMDPALGLPLTELLFDEARGSELQDTRFAQPALFAIEYGLAELLRSWGIEPDAVMGHSVGEIVAAWQAGVLSFDDAVRFVLERGRLMGSLPSGGRMLAIEAEPRLVDEWLEDHADALSIAAVNGPRSVVVSGHGDAVELIDHIAQAEGYRTNPLPVSHAFHSPLMDPILAELREVGDALRTARPRIPLVSNLTGDLYGDEIPPGYWADHARRPVMFHRAVGGLVGAKSSVIVEVGPHPTLTPGITAAVDAAKVRCQPTLLRNRRDVANLHGTVGGLHVSGVAVDFDRLFWNAAYRRVAAPHYPLRQDRHWIDVDLAVDGSTDSVQALHPVLGRRMTHAPRRSTFALKLGAAAPWADHRVLGVTVFPATGYLEMASRALAAVDGSEWSPALVRDMTFSRPLVLSYGKSRSVRISLAVPPAGGSEMQFSVSEDGEAAPFCLGRVATLPADAADDSPVDPLAGRDAELRVGPFYGELRKVGLEYGANFATIREIWTGLPGSGIALARITASPHDGEPASHPFAMSTLLDGCLQVTGAALRTLPHGELAPGGGAFIPVSIAAVELLREPQSEVWSHVSVRLNGEGTAAVAAIRVLDVEGRMIAAMDGLELRRRASLPEDGAAAPLRPVNARRNGGATTRADLVSQLREAADDQRVAILSRWLIEEIKDTLGQAAEEIDLDNLDPTTAFLEIGLDSLLVTELQRRIQEKLDFRFDAMEALDYQSIESLAEYALEKVLGPRTVTSVT